MAKKGKGFFGAVGSFLGSIPAVKKVKKAAKSVKKKIKKAKKKLKKALKKAKKKLKKKLGKVLTKARKLKNNLSKSKLVKRFKKAVKKAVKKAKKYVKKVVKTVKKAAKTAVKAVKKAAKTTVKAVKKAVNTTVKAVKTAVKTTVKAVKTAAKTTVKVVKTAVKEVKKAAKTIVKEVKKATKEAVKVYQSLEKMEPLKITKDMSAKEKWLREGYNASLNLAQKSKGTFDGTVDAVKGVYDDLKELVTNPIGVFKNTVEAISHPIETAKTIGNSIKDSFERDVVNGNAYSQAYWGTKATINTATAVVGTKGLGSLAKTGKLPNVKTPDIPAKFPTKQIDPKVDQHIFDKVAEARGQLSNKYKSGGNFAYAEVNISGVNKKDFYAHSGIQDAAKKIPGTEEFSFQTSNPTFKAIEAPNKAGKSFLRDVDTEYKILNDLAERIGTNYEAKGKVKLFTEKVVCDSCDQVIQQFNKKYPNIEVEVIHNSDNSISPK